MHNVFTFAIQIKTDTMKTYTNQPTIITNSLGVTSAIYANCEETITWKITCFGNLKTSK